jgi:hypothetical protein
MGGSYFRMGAAAGTLALTAGMAGPWWSCVRSCAAANRIPSVVPAEGIKKAVRLERSTKVRLSPSKLCGELTRQSFKSQLIQSIIGFLDTLNAHDDRNRLERDTINRRPTLWIEIARNRTASRSLIVVRRQIGGPRHGLVPGRYRKEPG